MVTTFLKQLAKKEAAASHHQLLGKDEPSYIHTLGNIPYKEEKYPGPPEMRTTAGEQIWSALEELG